MDINAPHVVYIDMKGFQKLFISIDIQSFLKLGNQLFCFIYMNRNPVGFHVADRTFYPLA
jgi:hypothetical protein